MSEKDRFDLQGSKRDPCPFMEYRQDEENKNLQLERKM